MRTLADEFAATNGNPILFDGREVQLTYSMAVANGDIIRITFLRVTDRPVQGIGVAAEKCQVRVAGTVARSIALWSDTAPKDVELEIVKPKAGASITLVNQWRDEKYGTTMYRLNNAAIEIVEQPDGSVILRCSDGWGEPDFNDLVVHVRKPTR